MRRQKAASQNKASKRSLFVALLLVFLMAWFAVVMIVWNNFESIRRDQQNQVLRTEWEVDHFHPCPQGLEYVANVPAAATTTTTTTRTTAAATITKQLEATRTPIPKHVFQTAKSKCVVPFVARVMQEWQLKGWEYSLWDDQEVNALLQGDHPQVKKEFPVLPEIARHCLIHGTLRADVWRYLVLWLYGGVYVDMDSRPNQKTLQLLTENVNNNHRDALFVVEQYHLLSQYFMAVSPRHPLMKLALENALQNVLQHGDVTKINAAFATGPHALHKAFQMFCAPRLQIDPALPGFKPVRAGTYWEGKSSSSSSTSQNRSVTVVGVAEHQNEYLTRDFLARGGGFKMRKSLVYQSMGMRHFSDDAKQNATGISCQERIRATAKQ